MAVNRLETCPTLIRTFCQRNDHHAVADYVKSLPSPELYLYTWRDATLREVAYTIVRSAKLTDVQCVSFNMVLPDLKFGGWIMRPLDQVDLKNSADTDTATLESFGFQPGYFFDVAYTTAVQS
jgi:hypothetical protein